MTQPHDHKVPSREGNGAPVPPTAHQPLITGLQSATAGDWSRGEVEPLAETDAPAKKERLFPRKVLIGWALLALVAYFGVRLVGTVIKESVRQAVAARTTPATSNTRGGLTIMLPNGKRIVIDGDNSVRSVPKPSDISPPATDKQAPAVTAPQPAPAATATQPAPPAPPSKKR